MSLLDLIIIAVIAVVILLAGAVYWAESRRSANRPSAAGERTDQQAEDQSRPGR